jgi:hypothetical protein
MQTTKYSPAFFTFYTHARAQGMFFAYHLSLFHSFTLTVSSLTSDNGLAACHFLSLFRDLSHTFIKKAFIPEVSTPWNKCPTPWEQHLPAA